MTENLKKFLQYAMTDPEIAKRISTRDVAQIDAKIKETIAIAKEKGIELSEADFADLKNKTLSDDMLDVASGGTGDSYIPPELMDGGGEQAGFFFIPIFFAANANIVANLNLAVNLNVDANANVNFNGNVSTNANIYDD